MRQYRIDRGLVKNPGALTNPDGSPRRAQHGGGTRGVKGCYCALCREVRRAYFQQRRREVAR